MKKRSFYRRKRKRTQKKHITKKAKYHVKVLTEDSVFSDKPSLVENWKGEGKEDDTAKILKQMKHMQNGNLSSTVEIENRQLKLKNTCGLDSVFFFLFCYGFIQNQNMKDKINLFSSGLIPEYLKCLAGAITSYNPYKIRADVVLKHFIKKNQN